MPFLCPICNSAAKSWRSRSCFSFARHYQLARCSNCDLMFWTPLRVPAEFSYERLRFGNYGVAHHGGAGDGGYLAAHQRGFARHYRGGPGRLLDIGCSDGSFLGWARDRGFEIYGVDVDAIAVERARRLTPSVWRLGLEQFADWAVARKLRFDVITFFDVLEHQPDARQFLLSAARLLRPGGWLAGTVPNRRRLVKTRRTALEAYWDLPPHHFLWFNARALRSALLASGLARVQVRCQMHGYATDELLRLAGKRVKPLLLGAGSGIQEPSRAQPGLRKAMFYRLRQARQIAQVVPRAVEAGMEKLTGAGGSLYFQGQAHVD